MIYSNDWVHRKIYEPVPRKFDGSRYPVYVSHRFPIKGGISVREVWIRQSFRSNPLFDLVMNRAAK